MASFCFSSMTKLLQGETWATPSLCEAGWCASSLARSSKKQQTTVLSILLSKASLHGTSAVSVCRWHQCDTKQKLQLLRGPAAEAGCGAGQPYKR